MANEILAYLEMCQREGSNLQRGMNFGLGGWYSVILMSVRPNSPYQDRFEEEGTVLLYEGHDEPRRSPDHDPKQDDQPEFYRGGALTENGKFYHAARAFTRGERQPERVRVYEKLRAGIWAFNGVFELVDAWREDVEGRSVFKFKLVAIGDDVEAPELLPLSARRRIIPTAVKLEVWKRDGGRCVQCGATEDLHFDHIIPYSLGGSSLKAENVQLLCARHNLSKSDKIE
jgi:hypothetical protein